MMTTGNHKMIHKKYKHILRLIKNTVRMIEHQQQIMDMPGIKSLVYLIKHH